MPSTPARALNPLVQRYMCADGRWFYSTQATNSDPHWPAMCEALGIAQLQHDPRFHNMEARRIHCGELVPLLDAVFIQKPAADWEALYHQYGLWGAPINDYEHLLTDPEIVDNGFLQTTPSGGTVVALPFKFLHTALDRVDILPALGADTNDVLASLCGYAAARIEALLRTAGVV